MASEENESSAVEDNSEKQKESEGKETNTGDRFY